MKKTLINKNTGVSETGKPAGPYVFSQSVGRIDDDTFATLKPGKFIPSKARLAKTARKIES